MAKTPMDTNGPIHSSHMPRIDIRKVLGDSPTLNTPLSSKARITANAARGIYTHSTLRSLLDEMITDIAHHPLRLSDTLEGAVSGLSGKGRVRLTTVGPSGHLATLQRALQDKSIIYDMNMHQVLGMPKGRGGSDMVAIVGMAGRFPGSETIEKFWEDLLASKSHIKRVRLTSISSEYESLIAYRFQNPGSISTTSTILQAKRRTPPQPNMAAGLIDLVFSTTGFSIYLPVKLHKWILSSASC